MLWCCQGDVTVTRRLSKHSASAEDLHGAGGTVERNVPGQAGGDARV